MIHPQRQNTNDSQLSEQDVRQNNINNEIINAAQSDQANYDNQSVLPQSGNTFDLMSQSKIDALGYTDKCTRRSSIIKSRHS